MKYKLPRFFNVFGVKVKLKMVLLPAHVAGQYEPEKEVITLNSLPTTEKDLLHTIIHECGHALFYRVSINQAISFEMHEFIVNNMATMLLENFDIKPKFK